MRFIFALIIIFTAACGGGDQALPTTPPLPTETPLLAPTITPTLSPTPESTIPRTNVDNPANQAYIRLIHAAPGVDAVNVEIQGLSVASRLNYGVITGETSIEAGEYTVNVTALNAPDQILLEHNLQLEGNRSTILLLTGTPEALTLRTFAHATAPLDDDETRVRFINALHTQTITIRQDDVSLSDGLAFGERTDSRVLMSAPTTLLFQALAGETIIGHPINLRGRNDTTLILIGTPETPRVISFSTITRGASQVRMINASPESQPVDIYLDGELFVDNLGYSRASERREIAAQTYEIRVYPAGTNPDDSTALIIDNFTPQIDEATTGVLYGTAGDLQITQILEALDPIRPEQARLQFMHVAPITDNINLAFPGIDTIPGLPDFLGFGRISPPIEIEADEYTIAANYDRQGSFGAAIENVEDLIFEPGRNYLYFITGQETPLIFSEPVDILEELADLSIDVQPSPTPRTPTQLRLVNVIEGNTAIDLALANNDPLVEGIAFGESTEYNIISSGSQRLNAIDPATGTTLATLDYSFETRSNYTVFVYGQADEQPDILVVEDPTFVNRDSANIRLVNLSPDDSIVFQLGYVVSTGRETNPEVSLTETTEQIRPNLFAGINRLTNTIAGRNASIHIFIASGTNDLIIIDPTEATLAARFRNIGFEPGTLYDMVIYQDLFSIEVRGFITSYNPP